MGQPGREEESAIYQMLSLQPLKVEEKEKKQKTSAGEDVEKLEPVCFASGNVKLCSIVQNSLAGPQTVKHRMTV